MRDRSIGIAVGALSLLFGALPAAAADVPAKGVWYYCASARAYYPSVQSCPEGWRQVPARAEDKVSPSAADKVPPRAGDDPPRWYLSTSVNYAVGDYGTGKDTTIVYVPLTLGVSPIDRLWLYATVPYLHQTTQNVVITGGGVASVNVKKGKGKGAQTTTTTAPTTTAATSTTEDGLGDVLLKVSYVLLEEKDLIPEVAPYVKIKFPTADKDRGLGTGEYDETLGVDVSKRLVDSLFGFVTVAYTFIGSPPGINLHNSFGWSLGAAYVVIPPLSVFAFLDGATAIARGEDDPLELRVGAELKIMTALKLTGAVTRGLSKGSADWGVSAGLALRF